SRTAAASCIVGQSDCDPMMMPTFTLMPPPRALQMRAHYSRRVPRRKAGSGDDVGREYILDPRDLVLEVQLLFLQPPQGELVGPAGRFHEVNRLVEVAVFLAQDLEFHAQDFRRVHFQMGVHLVAGHESEFRMVAKDSKSP